jgi:cytochrome c peroxidase
MAASFYFYRVIHKPRVSLIILLAILFFIIQCTTTSPSKQEGLRELIPPYIDERVFVHGENEFSTAKADLGRYLFYDRRLSLNNTKACATCHAPEFSFTDGYTRSIGALGDLHQRNSRPLINIIFNKYLTAADSTLHFPEDQVNNPMMNEHPVEMGMKGHEQEILQRLKQDELYRRKFSEAFPAAKDAFTIQSVQWAICSFVKTIFSFKSPYDRYAYQHDSTALNQTQQKGMQLFFSDSLQCHSCHGGVTFSASSVKDENGNTLFYFNTGLYNIPGTFYPGRDIGLSAQTGKQQDAGKYRVPTLRNLAFTAPYYHDGSAATLEEVVSVYEEGGRNVISGIYTGDGRKNPYKHPLIKGFRLNSQERKELVAFLLSLSDSAVCTNPVYANPFNDDETKRQQENK